MKNMKDVESKELSSSPEALNILIRLVESRLRFLESIKWTTRDDAARIHEMLVLSAVWSNLIEQGSKLKK